MAIDTVELAPAPGKVAPWADLIGKTHEWKARGPDRFDCYGLYLEMADRAGMDAPRLVTPPMVQSVIAAAPHVATQMQLWTRCERGPGALVALRVGRYVAHVGWVLPHDEMLHCWEKAGGVCKEPLSNWEHRIAGFYRWA